MRRFSPVLLALSGVLVCGLARALEAGAAKVEITPPLGTPLNGYYDRLGRGAVKVHDPVWARCLYLDDGQTNLFLVNADLCVMNRELRQRVLGLAPHEVPPEHIILTATHTHSAQGATIRRLLFRSCSGRFMPEVLEQTARGIAEAMRKAYQARRRATIGYGTVQQEVLSTNRRHPGGAIDKQIGVVRVDDSEGNAIVILANFAAHPTNVPEEDAFSVSADYVGFYYDKLEALANPGCIAMFTNGAEGNQRCANPEDKTGWERIESVGRLLAIRVKEAANDITCRELALHVGYSAPELPPTLADTFLPGDTVLQTLEIGDLLLTFFPGEPCVEIGLEMRRRALAWGYAAHFTVGLANDHLLYFVPRQFYGHLHYESGMSFYGPRIDAWFYREFSKLATRGEPEPARTTPAAPAVEATAGAQHIVLRGSPYEIGYQRGLVFGEAIRQAYQKKIVDLVDAKALIPNTGMWNWPIPFIDRTPLAVPRLAIGARPLLEGLAPEVFEEVEGIADATGLPFDAVWLVQCASVMTAQRSVESLYRTPFCTMFAVAGDRAGADDLLVGRNLDWVDGEPPVVLDIRPNEGHRFVQIGFAWNVGAFTGMNDAGLVLCVERMESLGEPSLDVPPIELILRELLQTADTLEAALARLAQVVGLRGYHVLAADPATRDIRVVEFGRTVTVREPVRGLLLGADPASDWVDDHARARYARVAELLEDERIIGAREIEQTLQDQEPDQSERACIMNERTRHSVIFEPRARRLWVGFAQEDGPFGAYTEVRMAEVEQ